MPVRTDLRIVHGGAVSVTESDDGRDKGGPARFRVRIITPGQGSSGTYTRENLAASAPLFAEGTQMYMDHPTFSEDFERPERSVRDLAGKLVSAAQVMPDGSLEADCEVYESFAGLIREKWQDIGVSINAWAYDEVDADGVVPVLAGVVSVDFVTKAGAGGALLEVLESGRQHKKGQNMTLDEIKGAFAEALAPVTARLDALEAATKVLVKEAGTEEAAAPSVDIEDVIDAANAVAESDLPDAAKARVIEAIKAGKDAAEAIKTEKEYVESVSVPVAAPVSSDRTVPVGALAFGYKEN